MARTDGALHLAARFIAALYTATGGGPGHFRRIADVAQRAGIAAELAVRTAERAGFLVVRVDDPEWVSLTTKGRDLGPHPGRPGGR